MNNLNYTIYKTRNNLDKDKLTQLTIHEWIHDKIAILKLGVIKSFNSQTQEAVVIIPEYKDLEIKTQNISNMHFNPQEGDKVILIQSSISLFDSKDNNYFDKNYF
ncbi:Hypothetical protein BCD_0943, partial (plasmid) [Borrelia crocidurae DOU]